MAQLKPDKLRPSSPQLEDIARIQRQPIFFILDNILDTYNIGGLFRLADAVAAQKVYLCGHTQSPPSSRIHKSAVGTENWVPWEHVPTALQAIAKIKQLHPNCQVIAIEQHSKAIPLNSLKTSLPVALVVGHETSGVSPAVLEKADHIVELPLFGINSSLNVVVAAGTVSYWIVTHSQKV